MGKGIDLKIVLNNIKAQYATKESSFEFFLLHSDKLNIYNVDYRKKFVDMRGEKTPSTIVNPYLTYCDFGDDGERHDIIYRIQELYNIKFPEAVKMLAEWVGENITEIPKEFKSIQKKEEKKRNPYTAEYLKEKRKEAILYSEITSELMQGLCRGCTIEEQRKAYSRFFIGLDSYEKDEQKIYRLFIPEKDVNDIPWGAFRYNKSLDPKGLLRKNSKRVLFGSHLMKYFHPNKPIIFTEGHSDTIVCNAKNMGAITTGSATTKIGDNIGYLKGKTLHFYPDCDEAGIKGVSKKIIEINKYNAQLSNPEDKIKYKVFWWAYNFISKKDDLLIDINFLHKIQQDLYQKEKYQPLPEDLIINWKVIIKSKRYVKQGFDFIDFFQEYFGTESLKRFQEKYSFIV